MHGNMGQQAITISKFEAGITDQRNRIQFLEQEIEKLEKQSSTQVSENMALQTSLQNIDEARLSETSDLAKSRDSLVAQVTG